METCPNCGADLPRNAKACPDCGSDKNTGWSDEAHVGSLDLPDEEFNYDKFVENEFGNKKKVLPQGIHWFWWAIAVALVLGALYIFFR